MKQYILTYTHFRMSSHITGVIPFAQEVNEQGLYPLELQQYEMSIRIVFELVESDIIIQGRTSLPELNKANNSNISKMLRNMDAYVFGIVRF